MQSIPGPAGAIVVGIDGSAGSRTALDWAVMEAQRRQLPLHLIYSADKASWSRSGYRDQQVPLHQLLAEAIGQVSESAPGTPLSWAQEMSSPVAEIVAASEVAELVVLGARGTGGARASLLGSVSFEVSARSYCPVVVVRESVEPKQGGPVVVGIAGSDHSAAAVDYAFQQAAQREVHLIAVHAWELEPGAQISANPIWGPGQVDEGSRKRSMVVQALSKAAATYPEVLVEQRILRSSAGRALIRHSNEASLVVVGTNGHQKAIVGFLGSVAQEVMRGSQCPVVVVRQAPAKTESELRAQVR